MWRGVFRRRAIFFLRTKRVEAISFWTEIWLHVIGHIEFASGLDASGRHPCDSTVYKRMYIQRYCDKLCNFRKWNERNGTNES